MITKFVLIDVIIGGILTVIGAYALLYVYEHRQRFSKALKCFIFSILILILINNFNNVIYVNDIYKNISKYTDVQLQEYINLHNWNYATTGLISIFVYLYIYFLMKNHFNDRVNQ